MRLCTFLYTAKKSYFALSSLSEFLLALWGLQQNFMFVFLTPVILGTRPRTTFRDVENASHYYFRYKTKFFFTFENIFVNVIIG